MSPGWQIAVITLWILALGLCGVVVTLMRLMGRMHERLGPAPALVTDYGPEVDSDVSEALAEAGVTSFPRGRELLVLFVSPTCNACEHLLASIDHFRRRTKRLLDLTIVSVSDDAASNAFGIGRAKGLNAMFLALPRLASRFRVGVTPHAFWVDADGVLRVKGVVNSIEHLESLENARRADTSSINALHEATHRIHRAVNNVDQEEGGHAVAQPLV